MTAYGECWFCRRGLSGPCHVAVVRCPACGRLVANRSCQHRASRSRRAGDAGIGLLLALLVAAGACVAVPRWRPLEVAHEGERRAPVGSATRPPAVPVLPARREGPLGEPAEAPRHVRRWLPVISCETLAAPASRERQDGARLATTPDAQQLLPESASACQVQVVATGPQILIEAPADAPEESLRRLARQKAEEVKWRYGVPRVRVTGYRQGDRYHVVVAPVEE